MGGDDIEAANGTPQNKVEPLFDRFLVGCVGDSTIFGAIEVLNSVGKDTVYLDGSKYTPPSSTDELCRQVCLFLPIIAKHTRAGLDEAINKKIFSKDWGDIIKQSKAKLLIIDVHSYTIHYADFGNLYNSSACSYTLNKLTTERAFRFGLAYPYKMVCRISDAVVQDPRQWCSQLIDESGEEVKCIEAVKHLTCVGKLGAYWVATPKGIQGNRVPLPPNRQPRRAHGPFTSLEDVAERLFPNPETAGLQGLSSL